MKSLVSADKEESPRNKKKFDLKIVKETADKGTSNGNVVGRLIRKTHWRAASVLKIVGGECYGVFYARYIILYLVITFNTEDN